MDFTFTNLTSAKVDLTDFYGLSLEPSGEAGDSVTLTGREASELPGLRDTQEKVADGTITFDTTPTADEIASGMLSPSEAIQADDMAPVDATDIGAGLVVLRKAMAAGGGGSPDDVEVFAAGNLPYKMRLVDAWVFVSSTPGASTVDVHDEAAGAGTQAFSFDSGTTGRKVDTAATGTTVYDVGAAKGIFLRRSDDAIAGEAVILVRREN